MAGRPGSDPHHVVPNPSGGWDTKRGAINQGRQVSCDQETEFRIRNRDGRIAQRDRHGWDSNPPKG